MRAQGARVPGARPSDTHGNYWMPLTLLSLAGAGGGMAGSRSRLAGGAIAECPRPAGIWDDITGSAYARRALPVHDSFNVVAEMGPADAPRTVVLAAHHDAAKSGLIFHPRSTGVRVAPAPPADRARRHEPAGDVSGLRRSCAGSPRLPRGQPPGARRGRRRVGRSRRGDRPDRLHPRRRGPTTTRPAW